MGEYRGSAVSVVEYLDKESGKKESYVKAMHSVEIHGDAGLETVHLQEMLDRAIQTPEEYKNQCWLEPGMQLLVVPRRVEVEKGIKKFTCATADLAVLRSAGHPEKGNQK